MELIVVTPPDYFDREGELINQFFAAGIRLLHLRKPENDPLKFRKLMMEIDPANYPLISIHQHHELAAEFSLKRLHYTEQQRKGTSVTEIVRLAEEGFLLSSSVHELAVLPELDYLGYVFFGPVFNSISKAGYQSTLDADFVLPPHEVKVFAIGGVSADRLGELKRMGFAGAAVLGTIWHQDVTPLTAVKKLISAINEIY